MATALNLTMKLKQDEPARRELAHLKENFGTIQTVIDTALKESELVHYARVLVIDDRYIQVLTEFDGSKEEYTEFFRVRLQPVFKAIFSLGEGIPPWDEINNRDMFYRVAKDLNLRALGTSPSGDPAEGFLFSAYGDATVKDIKRALAVAQTGVTESSFTG